jgi:hypothetical protein
MFVYSQGVHGTRLATTFITTCQWRYGYRQTSSNPTFLPNQEIENMANVNFLNTRHSHGPQCPNADRGTMDGQKRTLKG